MQRRTMSPKRFCYRQVVNNFCVEGHICQKHITEVWTLYRKRFRDYGRNRPNRIRTTWYNVLAILGQLREPRNPWHLFSTCLRLANSSSKRTTSTPIDTCTWSVHGTWHCTCTAWKAKCVPWKSLFSITTHPRTKAKVNSRTRLNSTY
jgi:hypothetical protein